MLHECVLDFIASAGGGGGREGRRLFRIDELAHDSPRGGGGKRRGGEVVSYSRVDSWQPLMYV